MTITQEYNLVLKSLDLDELAAVNSAKAAFVEATEALAVGLAAVTVTYAEKVVEIVDDLAEEGLDEEEISTCIKMWTPTYSAGKEKKRPGTISDKYLARKLKEIFDDRAKAEETEVVRDHLRPTLTTVNNATMDFLIPMTKEEKEKKEEREKAEPKTPIERLANSLKKFNAAGIVEALSAHPKLACEVLTALQAANIAATVEMENVVEIASAAPAARERLAAAANG